MPRKPSIALIGPGSLGFALGRALHGAGYPVGEVISRDTPPSLRRARQLARAIQSEARPWADAQLDSRIVWLCVSDDAIGDCARRLSKRGDWKGRIVLHSSGALSSELLAPLARRGASTASLHPMQSFVRS